MTSKTRSFRPSPALVIACIALFAALTGSAIAAGVGKNTVRSPQIVDGTIRTVDLRDNAVAAGKIAPDAVDTTEIAENGVESSDVAPDTLTAADLGPASVTSSEVADQSLTANDLGPELGRLERAAGRLRPRLRARHDHPGLKQHRDRRRRQRRRHAPTARPARP